MQLNSKSGFIFRITLIREYIIKHQDIKNSLQQSCRNIAPSLSLAEIDQLFKMDYSAVSQAAKRFEQKSKVNRKISEIKQKMITVFQLL
jgi:DNA-binding MarR family transcriptional regulator